ncbi:MAG: M15 family metallopeptidase [Clostridia bacterium]|nr:M15 family metallopeptidase [Clostridia bacterium]
MDKYLRLVNFENKFSDDMKEGFEFSKIDVNKDMNENKEFIETETYEAFKKLQKKLLKKGVKLTLNSAGRTVEEQQEYFDKIVKEKGIEYAQNEVATPGYSEHHLGLAIDVRIRSSNMLSKLIAKLSNKDIIKTTHEALTEFGFILRYPKGLEHITGVKKYEPWHFRYVGVEHAKAMQDLGGLCLERYIEYLNLKEQEEQQTV